MQIKKLSKINLSDLDKVFIAELVQDLPIWASIIMGLYKKLQNQYVYFATVVLGLIATVYILKKIKDKVYTPGNIAENPSDALAFTVYTFALLIVLMIGAWKNMLYMQSITWIYLIGISVAELIFFLKYVKSEQ